MVWCDAVAWQGGQGSAGFGTVAGRRGKAVRVRYGSVRSGMARRSG
jgi:hypothetical protein